MHWTLKTFGLIHSLFNTLCCTVVIVPLLIFKQIRRSTYSPKETYAWFYDVVPGSWYDKRAYWSGMAMGNFVLLRLEGKSQERIDTVIRHEEQHVLQQYALGVIQPVAYVIIAVIIYLFNKDFHPYYDNLFEMDARAAAGQQVIYTRDEWKDPNDRWTWW